MSLRRTVGALLAAGGILASAPAGGWGITVRLAGDIVVPAGVVHDGSVAAVDGDVRVEGTLRGDAVAFNGDVDVWGQVTGSVRVVNGRVLLRPLGRVDGDVWVVSGRVERFPGAHVGGRIITGRLWSAAPPRRPWLDTLGVFGRAAALWALVGSAALAAAGAALFPAAVSRIARTLSASPGASLLAGVVLWALLPPLAVALAVSIVGIPLLVLLPFAVSLLALAGLAGAALLVGERLTGAFRWRSGPVADALAGAVVLTVLAIVPGPGRLAFVAALAWGMGAAVLTVVRRSPAAPPSPPA